MTPHELMVKTNHHLIKGGELTDAQKANIVRQLFAAQSDERQKQSFYNGVRANKNDEKTMYPIFYIPPYNNGKKLQTVIPMSPGTHILAANSYELEIIRLLHLFTPDNSDVQKMVSETLKRLKTTCFGFKSCSVGECFHSALIVLRFIAAAVPDENEWINKQIALYRNHAGDAKRHSGVTGIIGFVCPNCRLKSQNLKYSVVKTIFCGSLTEVM